MRNPARDREDQPHRVVDQPRNRVDIHAALEAIAGVSGDSQRSPRGANARGIESRHLEKYFGCGFGDFAPAAANYPGDCLRPLRITNHYRARRKSSIDSVERLDQLFAASLSHDYGATRDLLEIECMHRLSEPEQHVVGRVNDIVDRAGPDRLESLNEPVGARSDFQSSDDGTRVAHAAVRVLETYGHFTHLTGRRLDGMGADDERLLLRNLRPVHGAAGRGCDLAREPFVREEIGAIGQNVDHEASVAERHRVQESGSGLRHQRERHDPLLVLAESKLLFGAQHSF